MPGLSSVALTAAVLGDELRPSASTYKFVDGEVM